MTNQHITTTEVSDMKSIFENYLAIVIGEKEIPHRLRRRGLTRVILRRSLLMFASGGGSRPKQLLDMAIAGNSDARKLLIDAALKGYERQEQFSVKSQQRKELVKC
ncbi:hypothetical protein H6F89_25125 [Cyanobacteria bacterium FACHB-63]|nr:hypothetical protein [Cyanobacteria bacterium FACHB-63]